MEMQDDHDVFTNWKKFAEKHESKLPSNWIRNPDGITIHNGNEPLDLIIEALKTNSLRATAFSINVAILQKPDNKLLEIFKLTEDYGRHYSLNLSITGSLIGSDELKALYKVLASKKSKLVVVYTDSTVPALSKSAFGKFLGKTKSVTRLDVDFPTRQFDIAMECMKGLVGLKKNKSIQYLKLTGSIFEAKISEILAENHTITSLELSHSTSAIEHHLLPAVAKMGSLKRLKFQLSTAMPNSYESLSEAIKSNKFLEKIDFYDSNNSIAPMTDTDPLATTIAEHPSLNILILPGTLICPLLKTISVSTVLKTLEVPLKQLMDDEELQNSLLAMKSLRKLIFRARHNEENHGEFDGLDLSRLVDPSSPIQTLVFESGLRFLPARQFVEILAHNTSVQRMKIKEFYYWSDLYYASTINPFLEVRTYPRGQSNIDKLRELEYSRMKMMRDLKETINCLTILRTIYLPNDPGLFATIPNEILLKILVHAYYRDINPYSGIRIAFNEVDVIKLISIASDRSKIRNEPDVRKRLQSLWIKDNLSSFCLPFK